MKYSTMLPNMRHNQVCGCMMYSNNTGPCVVCGEPTHYIEINYEGRFCSSECMDKFEKEVDYNCNRKDGTTL